MLSCKEVTTMIASDTLVLRPWRERIGVRMHLMMCRYCRRYAEQLRAIAAEARRLYADLPKSTEFEKSILKSLGEK